MQKFESWTRHLTARAFDNGIYVAACNQVGNNDMDLNFPGVGIFIGPDGKVISKTIGNQEALHMITIDTLHLKQIRSHKMRYFIPNRRTDLFNI